MIGVSLRTKWFYEPESAPCPMSEMLSLLKELGVESVELRSVYPAHDEEKVKAAADLLWDNGFNITIHCRVYSEEGAVNDVFGNLVPTLRSLRQKNLTITIHPKVGDNVKIQMNSLAFMSLAFIGYILPILICIATYFITDAITDNTVIADIESVGALIAVLVIFYIIDKLPKKSSVFSTRIIKIIR